MKPSTLLPFALAVLVAVPLQAVDSEATWRLFNRPPRDYATAPLWVWNDRLSEDQIRGTMRDLASQHVRQVFVHPRPGLMTPYLSEAWFDLWRVALDEARRLDMNVWIYDENSYPSGFAGGWVPELLPESRGRGLHFRESDSPSWSEGILSVFQLKEGDAEDVTAEVRQGAAMAADRYLIAEVRRAANSPWHGNRCYVDLLYPGVTEKFLEVTLGAYAREIGTHFGKRVPGIFTDEPEIRPAGGLPWTEDLAEQFERRWGYPLLPHLASLNREIGDWRRVRHNYFQTLLDLFIERWAQPYYERCEQLGLEFTGHYWEHDWPSCVGVPDNMAMAAWQQRPGIDILMNQYAEHTRAQFGNVRGCREIASVANQLGRARTLVEIYGAGGWDLRFEDMKRIADWLLVLGVNTLDEHLSYITLRGARKRDHPQSFSYHEPWWPHYGVLAQYFTRLSAVLSQGEQVNPVLVLEPTTTAWMHQGRGEALQALGDDFFSLLMQLERAQISYDLGCEDVLSREGSVVDAEPSAGSSPKASLRVGRRTYPVVVLPPRTENLNASTAALLQDFLAGGGTVLSCSSAPDRVDGRRTGALARMESSTGWKPITADALPAALESFAEADAFRIERDENDAGILFHHRREIQDGEIVFLVNTSLEHASRGVVTASCPGVELWDPFTGTREPAAFERQGARVSLRFDLPPCGSQLLLLSNRRLEPADSAPRPTAGPEVLSDPVQVTRLDPNVLTLDYVDITAGGESLTNAYFYEAQQFAFRQNGMERNPWDSAVQFRDELIARTFSPTSGFKATYCFEIQDTVPPDLEVVVERPDLYTVTCNDQVVQSTPGSWWLDRAFGRIPLSQVARVGSNCLTLTVRPFTIEHELEPVYVRGSFALRATDRGFAIVRDQTPACSDVGWNRQGHPFYSGGMVYRRSMDLEGKPSLTWITLPDWYGSVATIRVNGQPAGTIVSAPWEMEITDALQQGDNTIEVLVIGTLKNTLGPHHGNPGRGSAWPGMFHQGPKSGPPPGEDYDTIAYGLFAPFQIRQEVQP